MSDFFICDETIMYLLSKSIFDVCKESAWETVNTRIRKALMRISLKETVD